MKTKIESFLENEDNINIIAEEVSNAFATQATVDNVDYSFDIAKGSGKMKSKQPNTSFYFDTTGGTSLDYLKKALFDEDLAHIRVGSEEETTLMTNVIAFLTKVGNRIGEENKDIVEQMIRDVVLPSSNKESLPLDEVEIISIDIADYSSIPESNKYFLKIGKLPDTAIDTEAVVAYINEQQEETGKDIQIILEEEKEQNNPLFHNVIELELGRKYLYDINITLFVNYSLSNMPPKTNSTLN